MTKYVRLMQPMKLNSSALNATYASYEIAKKVNDSEIGIAVQLT